MVTAGLLPACGKDTTGDVGSGAGAGGVEPTGDGGAAGAAAGEPEETPGGASPEGGAGGAGASLGGAAGHDESTVGGSPGGAPADPRVCEPGRTFCEPGNVLTTCNAEGTGMLPEATDCGADAICRDGKCLPKLCAGASICREGEIAYCSEDGLSVTSTEACEAATTCVESGRTAHCEPQVCLPGLFTCLGNRTGKCGPDGLSLGAVTNDCESAGQVCVSHVACGESATDEMGASDRKTYVGENVFGNRITIRSSRQLTELSVKLTLNSERAVRFVVYEASSPESPATLIADKIVTSPSIDGYVSSGKLKVTLVAGRTYVLGVTSVGYVYADDAPYDGSLSFGTIIGSFDTAYQKTLHPKDATNESLLTLRATTILN